MSISAVSTAPAAVPQVTSKPAPAAAPPAVPAVATARDGDFQGPHGSHLADQGQRRGLQICARKFLGGQEFERGSSVPSPSDQGRLNSTRTPTKTRAAPQAARILQAQTGTSARRQQGEGEPERLHGCPTEPLGYAAAPRPDQPGRPALRLRQNDQPPEHPLRPLAPGVGAVEEGDPQARARGRFADMGVGMLEAQRRLQRERRGAGLHGEYEQARRARAPAPPPRRSA